MGFVSRGFFCPPGGPTEGLTLGVINRGTGSNETSYALDVTLTDHTSVGYTVPENNVKVAFTLDLTVTGNQTSVTATVVFDKWVSSTRAGIWGDVTMAGLKTAVETANSGWTCTATDSGSTITIAMTKASVAAGTYNLDIDGGTDAWYWLYDTGSADYSAAATVSGSSTQVATATHNSYTANIGDIVLSQSYSPNPGTEDAAVQFTCTYNNTGVGASTNQMIIRLWNNDTSTSANLTSPTTISNPNSWTIGSWTDAGTYWESTCTRAATFSGSNSITFSTTPAIGMTMATSITASSSVFTASDTNSVVVNTAMAYQAIGTVAAVGASSNLSVSWPSHATGDWGFLCVLSEYDINMPSTPSGWTLVAQPQGEISSSIYGTLSVYRKKAASGSESAVTITDNWNDGAMGVILTVRGANGTNPVDTSATDSCVHADYPALDMSIPGATTSASDCVVLLIYGGFNGGSLGNMGTLTAGSNLTSVTERVEDFRTLGSEKGALYIATAIRSGSGSYGNSTASVATATYMSWASVSIAVKA